MLTFSLHHFVGTILEFVGISVSFYTFLFCILARDAMLLFDETQMVQPPELTSHHNSRKYLILLPLRAIYFGSFYYETPYITPTSDEAKSTTYF